MRIATIIVALSLGACVQTAPPPRSEPAPPPSPAQPPPPRQAEGDLLADGEACGSGEQCQSGICEGQGCGPRAGTCQSRERMCTMDHVPYCGCEGETFFSSSGCPGRLFAHRGECRDGGESSAGDGSGELDQRPAGGACTTGNDCVSGICEGLGCGADQGVCAAKTRPCTEGLRTYCGCDGSEFKASSSCPGRRFSRRGPCDGESAEKRAVGASCDRADECASGICEGQGCGEGQGVCASRRRICTRDLRPYCGCEGQTFQASGSCPGRRYRHRGACAK